MRSATHRQPANPGFTLIELLVVITIIVVLLALLAPAMDRAMYQAELAVCGANFKGVASGALSYAMENRRFYPYRNLEATYWLQFEMIADPNNGYDFRPEVAGYISWDMFVDPLSGKIKVGPDDTLPDSQVFSPNAIWFGLAFPKNPGLKRIGDRLTWSEINGGVSVTSYFNVLVSDQDLIGDGTNLTGSHCDNTDVLASNQVLQDQGNDLRGVGGAASIVGRYTISRWYNNALWERGPVDRNFGLGDGSVMRLTEVKWNDYDTSNRTVKLPGILDPSSYPRVHEALPPQ